MSWWQYLMLANIYLALFYAFYALLLKKETFFQLNRIFLVASAVLSFVIPMIQADWVKNLFITQKVQYTIYSSPVMIYQFEPAKHSTFTVGSLLVIIYLTGILAFTVKFIWQTTLLSRMLKQPKATDAYSFFRKINVGKEHAGKKAIYVHEEAHAKQLHTADVMLAELVMIINWFNPVVYLYRSAIKNIHEFIADRYVLDAGSKKKEYALLLLSQAMNAPAHTFINPFFNSTLLKQRIIMLQKNRSNRVSLIKYGFSAPLFMLMLVLSSATVNNSRAVKLINLKLENVVLLPPAKIKETLSATGHNDKSAAPPSDNKTADTLILKQHVYTSVDQMPAFPGGLNAFYKFLAGNIHYPDEMRKNKEQGKVVIQFIVEKDGSLSNFRVIRSLAPAADNESVRVLKLSPNWTPGYQHGKAVSVFYTVPISFTLEDVPAKKQTGAVKGYNNNPGDKYTVTGFTNYQDTSKQQATGYVAAAQQPLYMIDGKEATGMEALNQKDIESITVLEGNSATIKYGEKGKNNVVEITMKKGKDAAKTPGLKNTTKVIDNFNSN